MDEKLVAACQMFLVPATILFAALAVATREALKTLLCIIGVVVSTAWLYRLYRWTELPDADRHTAFALAYIFFAAAVIATVVHFRLWATGSARSRFPTSTASGRPGATSSPMKSL